MQPNTLLGSFMPWIAAVPSTFIATLEISGEAEVRAALDRGDEWVTHSNWRPIAEGWLKSKEDARAATAAARLEAREERTLSLARRANLIAYIAVIIAAIAAHKEIVWLISSVMPWFSQ